LQHGIQVKKSPAPSFTVRAIKKWANVKNGEANSSQVRLKAELEPGQVLLRFDLNQELIAGGSLDAQLRVRCPQDQQREELESSG
jgi:hypothetical protein